MKKKRILAVVTTFLVIMSTQAFIIFAEGEGSGTPEKIITAVVYEYEYGKAESTGAAVSGIPVSVTVKNGTKNLTSGSDGKIEVVLNEDEATENGKYIWSVSKNGDHLAASGVLTENESGKVYVQQRYEPKESDWEFAASENIINGVLKSAGTYTIKGKDGKKLSKTLDGEAASSINVAIDSNGNVDSFYVYPADTAYTSKALSGQKATIDSSGPVIESVTTSAAENTTFVKTHGIYSKTRAKIIVDAVITDEGAGLDRVYIVGKKDGKETTYDATAIVGKNGSYSVDVPLPDEETIMDANAMYLVAIDKFGNKSTETLIAQSKAGSSVTLELLAPSITHSVAPAPNEHGWYDAFPAVTAKVTDNLSGLASVKIYQNGTLIKEVKYEDQKVTEEQVITAATTSMSSVDGSHVIKIVAEDNANNISENEFTIKVELAAPILSISGVAEGSCVPAAPEVTINETEAYYDNEGNKITATVEREGTTEKKTLTVSSQKNLVIPASVFEVNGKYTITADAVNAAGKHAQTKTVTFTKDATAPSASIAATTEPNAHGWYKTLPEVTASGQDSLSGLASLTITQDGNTLSSASYPADTTVSKQLAAKASISTPSATGEYTFAATAKDRAGNATSKIIKLKIDLAAPSVAIDGVSMGDFRNTAPEVTINETEAYYSDSENKITATVRKEGSSEQKTFTASGKNSLVIPASAFATDGKYTIQASAVDAAGNSSGSKSLSFTKDADKPALSIKATKAPNKNGWYKTLPSVTATAQDSLSGLASLNLREDDAVLKNGSYPSETKVQKELTAKAFVTTASNSGSYTFTATAKDHAGNETTKNLKLKIDLDAPVLSASGVVNGTHYKKSPAIKINLNEKYYKEKASYIKYVVTRDGKSASSKKFSGVSSATIPSSAFSKDGQYKVVITSADAAGNAAKSLTYSFIKDSTAPVVKISGSTNGRFYNKSQNITISVTEKNYKTNAVKITATKKLGKTSKAVGFPWSNKGETSTSTKQLGETGEYTITATATDKAGNTSKVAKLTFSIDMQPPVIKISGVTKDAVYKFGDTVAPVIEVTDDYPVNKAVSYIKGGKPVSNPSFAAVKDNDGQYTLAVTATDKAGNSAAQTLNFTINRFGSYFKYDSNIKDLQNEAVQDMGADLTITEKNVSKVKESNLLVIVDGKSNKAEARTESDETQAEKTYKHIFSKSNFIEEGAYEINVVSKDEAGNESESKDDAGKIKFYVDRTPPSISITGIDPNGNKGNSATLTVNVNETLSGTQLVSAMINGEEKELMHNDDGTYSLAVGEGMRQNITVTATDKAGNTGVERQMISVSNSGTSLFVNRYGRVLLIIGILALIVIIIVTVILLRSRGRNEQPYTESTTHRLDADAS